MNTKTFFLLALLPFCIFGQQIQQADYTLQFRTINEIPTLQIEATFSINASDTITQLSFPDELWGVQNLRGALKNVQLMDKKGHIDFTNDTLLTIHHPRSKQQLQLSYAIVQNTTKDIDYSNFLSPIIQPTYFHALAQNIFILPKQQPEDALQVSLTWKNDPLKTPYHNSFGANTTQQKIKTTAKKFAESIHISGDYRLLPISIREKTVYIAIRGQWIPFDDARISSMLQEITTGLRTFWNDFDQDYYLVTISPMENFDGVGYTGACLTNSFATAIANNESIKQHHLTYLFNHEMTHNWTGVTIINENEEQQYWFSEGFTDYINIKTATNLSYINHKNEYFINKMNGKIRNYWMSPAKRIKNEAINYETFWSDQAIEKIPYQRGTLFAFLLDLKINYETQHKFTFQDLLQHILKDGKKGQKLNHSYFITTVNQFFKEDLNPIFKAYIEEGEEIPFATIFQQYNISYEPKGYENSHGEVTTDIPELSVDNEQLLQKLLKK